MVRATGWDFTTRAEDLLPAELKVDILKSIAEKKAATEAALDEAKGRAAELRAEHSAAQHRQRAKLQASGTLGVHRRGYIVQASDIEERQEIIRLWKAGRVAEERVTGLETLRSDLAILERKAQMGMKEVVTELAQRWQRRVFLGGAVVLRDGESAWGPNMTLANNAKQTRDRLAAMSGGGGDIVSGAMGPIQRLQRRMAQERQRAEARRAVAAALRAEKEKSEADALAEKEKSEKGASGPEDKEQEQQSSVQEATAE